MLNLKPTDQSSELPAYRQLVNQIRRGIADEGLQPGTRLPDIKTIAARSETSIKTVSRAFAELIEEGVCYRRPKTGTFVADPSRRLARADTRRLLGVYNINRHESEAMHPIHSLVLDGIRREAEKHTLDLLFASGDVATFLEQYAQVPQFDFTGLISYSPDYRMIGDLARKFPALRFVVVNYLHEGFEDTPDNVYGVFNDDFGGAYAAADRFISEGARHLGFIYYDLPGKDETYLRRLAGVESAARDRGVEFSALAVTRSPTHRAHIETAAAECAPLFEKNPGVDAVFGANDAIAVGVSTYLQQHLPDRPIRLCGHDNVHEFGDLAHTLNTLNVDFPRMGAKAVEMATGPKPMAKSIKFFPQLIVRSRPGETSFYGRREVFLAAAGS